MLVLDTRSLQQSERAEAFQIAASANCTESVATFEEPRSHVAKLEFFDLGPATVFNIDASGTTLKRTPRLSRAMTECIICLALPMRTNNRLEWDREDQVFGARDLMLVDLSAPYVYEWRGVGASYAFQVDFTELGLPMDAIHAASPKIKASPIYSLVRDHVWQVMTQAEKIVDSGSAPEVAAASVELMRALIVSSLGDSRRIADVRESSLLPRIQAYVRTHLRDANMTPAQIAAFVHISVRALYKLYESIGTSLEQSIIEQRLEGARGELSSTAHAHRSVSDISSSWGFNRLSYFSTRFHQQFGVTPRQVRPIAAIPRDGGADQDAVNDEIIGQAAAIPATNSPFQLRARRSG